MEKRGYSDDRYLIGLSGLIALRSTKIKTKQARKNPGDNATQIFEVWVSVVHISI